jgi:hypothetical protein
VPSIPGDHAYDVIYRATADFTDLFAEVAAAKVAMEELKKSANETNSSSEESSKAAADAERARTKAMQDASKAAKDEYQQQILLNKALNNGFNTPQEAKAFEEQKTQSKNLANLAENDGRQTRALATQDLKDQTAALNDRNKTLKDYNDGVKQSVVAFTDANKGAHDLESGLSEVEKSSKDVKQSLDATGGSLDELASKAENTGTVANQSGSMLREIGNGAREASKGIDEVNQALSESSKAFLEYQQSQKDANAALSNVPTNSGALGAAQAGIADVLQAQASEKALSRGIHTESITSSARSVDDLTASVADLEAELEKMKADVENDPISEIFFAAKIAKVGDQLSVARKELVAAQKEAAALDGGLNEVAKGAEEAKGSLEGTSSELKSAGGEADSFSRLLSRVSSAAGVVLVNDLESLKTKLDDMKSSLEKGGLSWEDFSASIAKADKQLASVQKQASALDEPAANNAVSDLRKSLNDLSVQALKSKDDISVFRMSEEEVTDRSNKLVDGIKGADNAIKGADKAAKDASVTFKIFGQGLKDVSNYFATLSAQTKAEGGGTGFLGFLGNVFGGGLGGISSGIGALAAAAGSALPLIIGLAAIIPALATGIVALAGAVVGLLGAMSPLVGVLATFLPIVIGIAEAFAVLKIAIDPLIKAVTALNAATTNSGVTAALKGLSPVMRTAALDISAFEKALKGSGTALSGLGTTVFTPLLGSLGQLKTVIKPVEQALTTMAGAIGQAVAPVFAGFIAFLKSSDFQTLTKAAATSLVYFGQTVSNFLSTIGMIAVAAAPYTVIIAKWFDTFTKGMKDVTTATIANGGVNQFFQQMLTALQEIGQIVYQIGRAFDLWGSSLAPVGNFILVGIARFIKDIADEANKVDFKQWNTDIEKLLSSISTLFKGVGSIFAALINNKFLTFLATIFTDVGNIAKALAPIVKFFVDIVAGSLPTFEKILNTIAGVILTILKPIDTFLGTVGKSKDAMKILSDVFTALGSLVIAGSVITFFSLLAGMAGKGFSGLIDLINKIPGINLPGGSGKGGGVSGDAEAITTNADANATRIVEAITGTGAESGAGAAAGGAEGAAGAAGIGATATIAGIVTAVLAFLGAGFLIYEIIHGIQDPNSTVAKANKSIGNAAATAVLGPPDHLNWFGRVQRDDENSVKAVGRLITGGNQAFNKAVGDFFTDKTQWQKASDHAIADFFSDNTKWEKASNHAIADFFTDNTQWEKSANHAIADFFTDNTQWEKAADKSISGWFKSAGAWFMRDVYDPIEHWVVNDFVGFFTNSVARWFRDVGSWFMRDVYNPVEKWITGDFVNFFTNSIPRWFSDVGSWFMRDVYNPVEKWITGDFVNFFTSSIPNWFKDVWKWFQRDIVDPVGNWLTGTGNDSLIGLFTSGFTGALNAVIGSVFNNGIIRLLNDALGVIGAKIPDIPKLAGGGHVPGNLGESDTSDSVWAKLTPGEFVIRKRAAAALGPETLAQLNQADRLGAFAGGGIVGGLLSSAEGLAGDVAGWASSFVSGALKDTFDAAYSAVVNPILGTLSKGTVATGVVDYGAGSVKSAVDSYLGGQDAKANASALGALGGTLASGAHLQIIAEALKAAGVSGGQWPAWEAGLNTLITRESGWNPNSINRTDANALAGDPSEGLAQTTGSTFAAFHVPGTSNNILDPVANVAAAIRYIESVYGSITNVQQANANMPAKGYASGGFVGDPTLGMGFASGGAFGMAPVAGSASLKSQAGMNAGGRLSGPGVHVENLNITNPIPEQSGDSLQRAMTRLRVYDGRGS